MDSTLGRICPIPMPVCIMSAGINDVTLQAICGDCNVNKIISVQQCKDSSSKGTLHAMPCVQLLQQCILRDGIHRG